MVHAYMMEIKEYDVRAHEHGMMALSNGHENRAWTLG